MSLSQREDTMIGIEGHIKIWDPVSGEVLVRRRNAVNFENMSIAIANLLSNKAGSTSTHQIGTMRFGNGGTTIDGLGTVTYKVPNTSSSSGTLYNSTHTANVDAADAYNKSAVSHTANNTYSDVEVTCTLDYNVPAGQDATDTATSQTGTYIFDELGIYSANGDLLTHVVFHPVQKSANRKIQVVYTLRIRTSFQDI